MKYTVRYAHLKDYPAQLKGQIMTEGDYIGTMGNTGSSSAAHLHIDCIYKYHFVMWRLFEMENGLVTSSPTQLVWFIDDKLFKTKIHITSYYFDPDYRNATGKNHPAFDVVPQNRHYTEDNFDIFWNRSYKGRVLASGFDLGYGNYILVGFEV